MIRDYQSVLTPIIFFDLFDVSLSRALLANLIYRSRVKKDELVRILERLRGKDIIDYDNDVIWLTKRRGILKSFPGQQAQTQSLKLSVKSEIRQLAKVPFIKLICLTNSLSMGTANLGSDIDLLIVTDNNCLGLCRDYVNVLLGIRKKRADGSKKSGQIAIDIWLEERALDLSSFRLTKDIYFDFWFAHLTPILDRNHTFDKLVKTNRWIYQSFPQFKPKTEDIMIRDKSSLVQLQELILKNQFGKSLNTFLISSQLRRLEKFFRGKKAGAIKLSETQLRFNIPDRRPLFQKRFEDKLLAIATQIGDR